MATTMAEALSAVNARFDDIERRANALHSASPEDTAALAAAMMAELRQTVLELAQVTGALAQSMARERRGERTS